MQNKLKFIPLLGILTYYEKKILAQLIDEKINSIRAEIEFDTSEYKELIKVVADNEIKHLIELKDKILP